MKYIYALFFMPFLANASDSAKPDYQEIHAPFIGTSCYQSHTQYELDQCTQASLDRSIAEVKRLVEIVIRNKEDDGFTEDLKHAQEIWEQHKVATCTLQTYESKGGSGFSSILGRCLEAENNERISFLNWFIENP